jgi:signal transduction histidine kinase
MGHVTMTFASDKNLDLKKLSLTSRRMLELREAVFTEWEKRVREAIRAAGSLPHPILIDTFPALYANLAESLTPAYPRATADVAGTSIGLEHGSERVRLTNYDPNDLINEYQILRSTIVQILHQNDVPLDNSELLILNSSIDNTIKDAVHAFVLAQSAFREQFVASIVHDLRNPLTAANVAAELILRTTDLRKISIFAKQIVANHERMDQMIQNLLDAVLFQRGERIPLHPSNFDMLEAVEEVCEQSKTVHGDRFQILGEPVHGWWEREAVKRALENLVGNAAKYGTPGTPIRVKIDSSDERVVISVHNEGDPIVEESDFDYIALVILATCHCCHGFSP